MPEQISQSIQRQLNIIGSQMTGLGNALDEVFVLIKQLIDENKRLLDENAQLESKREG